MGAPWFHPGFPLGYSELGNLARRPRFEKILGRRYRRLTGLSTRQDFSKPSSEVVFAAVVVRGFQPQAPSLVTTRTPLLVLVIAVSLFGFWWAVLDSNQ